MVEGRESYKSTAHEFTHQVLNIVTGQFATMTQILSVNVQFSKIDLDTFQENVDKFTDRLEKAIVTKLSEFDRDIEYVSIIPYLNVPLS